MSSKNKKKIFKRDVDLVKDPFAVYVNAGLTFSSIETQGDYLLNLSIDRSPTERLAMMVQLNEHAFGSLSRKKKNFKNTKITFSRYEYIP